MFYSHQILARKGPLGTIWIAAHLDRKLRKAQVYETDIEQSVDTIMYPKVPIALRLSANLMLGVVRIYNRKVNYLFQDCSEALVKMKQAFKAAPSAAVDLPLESAAATYAAVTLPEHNYDVQIDLLLQDAAPPPAYDRNLDAHVTTRDSITLPEVPAAYGSQMDYEDRFALPGETTLPPMEDEVLLPPMEDEAWELELMRSTAKPHREALSHGGMGDDHFATPMAVDTPDTLHGAAASTPVPSASKGAYNDNSFDFVSGAPQYREEEEPPAQSPRGEDKGGLLLNTTANNEDPPMSEAKVKQARNRRAPKRRRIQVDETTEIPPAQIRAALDDTSDILRPKRVADLNTISSQLQGYRRFAAKGGLEKGFSEPSVQGVPPALYVLYARVMVPGGARLQGLDAVPAAEPAEAPEETPAKSPAVPPADDGTTPVTPDSTAVKAKTTPMTIDEDIRPSFGGEPLDFTAQQLDFPTQDVEHAAAPAGAAEEVQEDLQQDGIDNMHIAEERARARTGPNLLERHSLVEDEEEDDDEAGHVDKSGWSVRTRNVASFLKKNFKEMDRPSKSPANKKAASHSTLGLDAMVAGKSRREAARMFFEMLVLKTKDYVHLEQEEPYSDITISARPRLLSARV
eukprot:jgi/Chlat1/1371/Chrsp119S01784